KTAALKAVEKLRKADPVPAHPGLHAGKWNRLGALHSQHCAFAVFRLHWSKTETAVADCDCGNSVPSRQGGVGVPPGAATKRGVIMSMDVDEAGSDHHSSRVDGARRRFFEVAHRHDFTGSNADVPSKGGHPHAVHDRAASD